MRVDCFDFELPAERIALEPAQPRDSARMLVVRPDGALTDTRVAALPEWLRAGDVLVVNDTRVIPARLSGVRERAGVSARIEATLHKREAADAWWAFLKPAKKLAIGEAVVFSGRNGGELTAVAAEKQEGGDVLLRFAAAGAALDAAVAEVGSMPLPPYIASRRPPADGDVRDYQTLFAEKPGAVAAPTAGLHFTPELLDSVAARGIAVERVTLHVGAGTFLPVKVEDTDHHRMHAEWGRLDEATAARLRATRAAGGRIVAVGTTALRTLEAAAADGTLQGFSGDIALFITPGYRFRAVDLLLTNFHLPRSTLFMLVAAFSGLPAMQAAYAHAVAEHYRFYSYGDACLLHPPAA